MKYLKKYENTKKSPNFKEGDYVICIDNENSVLTKNRLYLVKRIFNPRGYYVCKVTSKLGTLGENLGTFSCDRFISEFEHNIQKYNL